MRFFDYYLKEEVTDNFIVIYSGRFQPFHSNHYQCYLDLVRKFDKDKVYIATSDKVELPLSPFSFDEKKRIIVTMFEIPEDKIVQVKNPYKPSEVFEKLNDKNVGYISALGKKDSERLSSGDYFVPYGGDKKFYPYTEHGYVYIMPEKQVTFDGKIITGSLIRKTFTGIDEDKKRRLFDSVYPKFDKDIFDLMINKIR